jgi:hypothetical protein
MIQKTSKKNAFTKYCTGLIVTTRLSFLKVRTSVSAIPAKIFWSNKASYPCKEQGQERLSHLSVIDRGNLSCRPEET